MLSHLGESFQILAKHTLSYLGELQSRKIEIGGEKFSYLEGGSGQPLLLLHGLAGSKTQWRTVMQQLAEKYRVIAVEMPGFSLQQLGHPRYRVVRDMVAWLQRFADGLQLNTFHLMAACTGAVIAAHYCFQRPGRVTTLTMIGLPDLQDRSSHVKFIHQLMIRSPEDVDLVMQNLFYRAPAIPNLVKRYYVDQVKSIQPDFNNRLEELSHALPQLVPRMRSITIPVLLVSGVNDIYSHLTSLEFVRNCCGGSVDISQIAQCGHLPFVEKPEQLVSKFVAFQESHLPNEQA